MLAAHTACRNRRYALSHDCDFENDDGAKQPDGWHPSWSKIPLLLRAISTDPHRALLWLDSDAVVHNTLASPFEWLETCRRQAPHDNPQIQLVLQSTP